MADEKDLEAPHGRDEQGVPLAPYGHRADGRPKMSARGRPKAPAKKPAPNVRSGSRKRTRTETKHQLVELVGMLTTSVAAAAESPSLRKRLGDKGDERAMAMSGAAVIIDAHAEPGADALIQLAQVKPGVLAWMDQVEDKAPYLALMKVGLSLTKSLVQNFMRPDPALAEAGRKMVAVRAARMAAAIEQEYAELGLAVPAREAEGEIPRPRAA